MLYRGAKIIILDEPTAVLVPQEVDALFANLRELKAPGHTLLFISHKLDEVLAIADDITVDAARHHGRRRPSPEEVTTRQLAELMVGSELPSPSTEESTVTDDVHARRSTTSPSPTPPAARCSSDVSLRDPPRRGARHRRRRGQRPGRARRDRHGHAARRPAAGSRWATPDITAWDTRERREAGIGYIPEDRQRHGLLLDAPLWENRILGHQSREPVRAGHLDQPRRRPQGQPSASSSEYDVRTPAIDTTARALSGGNQQKFIVGREMSGDPVLLIASHPTRGVDVGAQAAIWDHIQDARRRGLAVLLISADLDELIGLSDTDRGDPARPLVGDFDPHDGHPAGPRLGDDRGRGQQGGQLDAATCPDRRWLAPVLAIAIAMLITHACILVVVGQLRLAAS